MLIVVLLLLVSLVPGESLPTGEPVWTTGRIQVPEAYEARCCRHLFTGETVSREDRIDAGFVRLISTALAGGDALGAIRR